MMPLSLVLLVLLLQLTGTPPGPIASIEGVVLRAGTTEPLANVMVSLGGRTGEKTVVTTEDGQFSFQQLEPGPYFLTATLPGYIRDELTPFTLKPNDHLKNVRIAMKQTGSISGQILDAGGEPLVRALVQAQRFSYHTGVLTLSTVQAVLSNDLGEYRLFWLPPGNYVISATASDPKQAVLPTLISPSSTAYALPRSLLPNGRSNTGIPIASHMTETSARIEEASLPVYYPGTSDANTASRVELRSGTHLDGIDIRVMPVRTHRIRGRVVSAGTGAPLPGATISVIPRHPDSRAEPLPLTAPANAASFEMTGVPPGNYFLVAQTMAHGNGIDSNSGILGETGFAAIEVGNADLDNVTIVARPSYRIPGRVLIEGQPPAQSSTGGRAAQVVLRAEGRPGNFFETTATVSNDGSFTLVTGFQGEFQVFLRNYSEIGYVRSIRLGASDALNGNIRLDGPPQVPLEIVISPRPGTLQGVVLNEKREPIFSATVVLVPEPQFRNRADLYVSARTEAGGTFRMIGIAPGVYKVFAWENVEQNAWLDAEFLRSAENLGRPLSFVEGSAESVELNAIPYP